MKDTSIYENQFNLRIIDDYFKKILLILLVSFGNMGVPFDRSKKRCCSLFLHTKEKKEGSETPYSDEPPSLPFGRRDKRGRPRIGERGGQHRDE